MPPMNDVPLVAVRGGGDLGTGAALRLHRCGLRVVVAESPAPTAVRRTVAFSEAVFDGHAHVEGVQADLIAHDHDSANDAWTKHNVPVLVDPSLETVLELRPDVLVDAIVAKVNRGVSMGLAPGTVALGPGFIAGTDVHAVVETNRGPNLGRVLWTGTAEPNTHTPGPVGGHSSDRVLRSPAIGPFVTRACIGDIVETGEVIGTVSGQSVLAPFHGLVRGLVRSGFDVLEGMKIGDVDPRLNPELCTRVSDKALAVAGGVVEASITLLRDQGWEWGRL